MKKFNLLKFGLALTMLSGPLVSSAQDMLKFETNFYKDYVGNRIMVASPANLAKELKYNISNDGSGGANEWGGAIPAAGILNTQLVKGNPYDACDPILNGSAMAGKIALVYRGDCEFGEKAKAVENAGAIACIIVNNIDGGPVGMGAGGVGATVTIPVIMISKAEGLILSNALDASTTVTMSLSKWGNNLSNDIGIVNSGNTQWHEYAIPIGQIKDASSLAKNAYKAINGAVIANFGSADQSNIRLVNTVSWTPTGGSATVIHKDSVVGISIAALDSIRTPYAVPYQLPTPTTTGRIDVTQTVSIDGVTDQFPNDNTVTSSFHVTSHILSKGRYDFATNRPVSTISFAFATASDFIWGPLHYIAKGGYQVTDVQFAVSKNGDTDLSTSPPVNTFIWKWKDGNNGMPTDGIIQAGEIDQVGIASRTFAAGDTGGQVFTCKVVDDNDNTKPMITEDDTWYWTTVSVPIDHFLACDGELNYYPRSFGMSHSALSFDEFHAPLFRGTEGSFTGTNSNEAAMYPFEATNVMDSVRFSQQKQGTIPSVPFLMSIHPVSVNDLVIEGGRTNVDIYPNPASDVLNVSVKQDKVSATIAYTVLDAAGKVISYVTHSNVQNDTYSVQTSKLPAGNYFLVVNANDKPTVRTFTVVK